MGAAADHMEDKQYKLKPPAAAVAQRPRGADSRRRQRPVRAPAGVQSVGIEYGCHVTLSPVIVSRSVGPSRHRYVCGAGSYAAPGPVPPGRAGPGARRSATGPHTAAGAAAQRPASDSARSDPLSHHRSPLILLKLTNAPKHHSQESTVCV